MPDTYTRCLAAIIFANAAVFEQAAHFTADGAPEAWTEVEGK